VSRILEDNGNIDSFVLVGDYGSGKTEVAVNLSLHLAQNTSSSPVAIADLDLVNPYFRCREAHEPLEERGIRVVMPEGGHQFADLPILLPQVKGLLQDHKTLSVLDVGGDEVGSRVLAALAPAFDPLRHHFLFVVNTSRPFNDTAKGVHNTIRRIESTSGLSITGLVSNTHMMDETTGQMVMEGLELTRQVASTLAVPVFLVAVMEGVLEEKDQQEIIEPLMTMNRIMVPPWLRRKMGDQASLRLGGL
jgi:hypothetical protein